MLQDAFDAYRVDADGPLSERLRFLEGLVAIQTEVAATATPSAVSDAEVAHEGLLTGQPLFLAAPPTLPRDEFVAAVERIAAYVAQEAGLDEAQAAALRAADFAGAITGERLRDAASSVDLFVAQISAAVGANADADLKPATCAYVVVSALSPFFASGAKAAVESLGGLDKKSWTLGTCPVCGSPATLGVMGESTKEKGSERVLWCGLCHTKWVSERLACARCGNRAADRLRYVHVDGDPAHRLHLCDECHGYLRVVFASDLAKPLSMVVEDAVTATLDGVARNEGYTATGEVRDAGA